MVAHGSCGRTTKRCSRRPGSHGGCRCSASVTNGRSGAAPGRMDEWNGSLVRSNEHWQESRSWTGKHSLRRCGTFAPGTTTSGPTIICAGGRPQKSGPGSMSSRHPLGQEATGTTKQRSGSQADEGVRWEKIRREDAVREDRERVCPPRGGQGGKGGGAREKSIRGGRIQATMRRTTG